MSRDDNSSDLEQAGIAGRRFVVTGANTGIGRATAEALARAGGRVVLACRSEERARPVLEAIRNAGGVAEFVAIDLAELASVRDCAARLQSDQPIHVLINNAGLAWRRGLTKDGFELAFGVNHLGHYLLTRLLLDRLRASAPARVVNVASASHFSASGIDWDAVVRPTRYLARFDHYAVSKLCNVLFTRALARRMAPAGVTAYALHPGVVASDVWHALPWPIRPIAKLFMKSTSEGARTTIYCATSPEVVTGRYYENCEEKLPSELSQSDELADELWRRSAEWVGLPP